MVDVSALAFLFGAVPIDARVRRTALKLKDVAGFDGSPQCQR